MPFVGTLSSFPKSLTTDCVKCFGKVDKGHVEVHILFLAFFLKLSCCEDHVYCSSVLADAMGLLMDHKKHLSDWIWRLI